MKPLPIIDLIDEIGKPESLPIQDEPGGGIDF